MPIEWFNITNTKILRKAYCDNVPKVMVIAGPNGVGKSTLLFALRKLSTDKVKGSGKILYTTPHRTWRKRNLRASWIWDREIDISSILASDSIQSIQGIYIPDGQRRPDTADEAQGFIKYVLSQLETRRQNAIVTEIDRNGLKYPEGYAPDVYKPLRDMMEDLLPHMRFVGVDQENKEDVRCLLKPSGVDKPIDIDELSSGEKEMIALFMPLVENEINSVLRQLEINETPGMDTKPDTVMLIDEPDLHIHSILQKRIVEYMRKKAHEDNVQFIIATHSPIIINEATSDELFVLVEANKSRDNQLQKVVSNPEKYHLLKSICGDVAILTLGRPIVFIEGKSPSEARSAPSDQRILELLWEGAKDFTFVPMGGKEEAEESASLLNEIIHEKLVGFPVYAIVDADLSTEAPPSILQWEFCTIENALLDPVSIFNVLEPYREKTELFSADDVEKELLNICSGIIQTEIDRRIRKIVPPFCLRFQGGSIEELIQERDSGINTLRNHFTNPAEMENIKKRIQDVRNELNEIIKNKKALMRFDGKVIMRKFYQQRVGDKSVGMNFASFCYSVAKEMSRSNRTPDSIKKTLTLIRENLDQAIVV